MTKPRRSRKNQKKSIKRTKLLNNIQPLKKRTRRQISKKIKKTVSFNELNEKDNHQQMANIYKSVSNRTPTPYSNQSTIYTEPTYMNWKDFNNSIINDNPTEKKEKILNAINKGNGNVIYGYFWMDGCGHCEVLHPIWLDVINEMRINNPEYFDTNFRSENANEAISVINDKYNPSKRISVDGFPTIYLIKNGNLKYHTGERSKDSIIQWLTNS